MRADDFLARAGRLPVVDIETLTGGRGLLVVAPHPDDETLGCGGAIAEACELGLAVRVLVVSDGAGSHPNSRQFPPDRLCRLRERETREAVAELGLSAACVDFLGLPDRRVPGDGPQADAARKAIVAAAWACGAGAVLATWRYDLHGDHAAVASLVEGIDRGSLRASRYAYPIWAGALAPDADVGPPPVGFRVDVGRQRARKARAIARHRSQTSDLITDDPEGFRLTAEMIASLTGPYEVFLRVDVESLP